MQCNNQELESIMDLKQRNIFWGKTSYIVHKKSRKWNRHGYSWVNEIDKNTRSIVFDLLEADLLYIPMEQLRL